MPNVSVDTLVALQANTRNIRNICIVAHVDHGKTTLSDSLISSNGIISPKLAGKIKYLDNRPDEQERRITIKSSCISLYYKKQKQEGEQQDNNSNINMNKQESEGKSGLEDAYLINLIDSPGHVDFSSEVSTAVRLSDGCLVVVDVVEGACIQTQAVLRQAWSEKLRPCLVLNKIDRLITELHLTPLEAYQHLVKVLEQVNFITGSLYSEEYIKSIEQQSQSESLSSLSLTEEDKQIFEEGSSSVSGSEEKVEEEEEEDEGSVFFSPEKGNVVFASAHDLWGFRISDFCDIYSSKLGVKKEILMKTLWGEYYFNTKTKKIHKKNTSGKMIPMFVHFVLNNIWEVYNASISMDKLKIDKIVKSLKLKVTNRDINNEDTQQVTRSIMSKWLSLSDTILDMVINVLPDPISAQSIRLSRLWQPSIGVSSLSLPSSSESDSFIGNDISHKQIEIENDMLHCNKDSNNIVIYVSKVVSHSIDSISRKTSQPKPRGTINMDGSKQLIETTSTTMASTSTTMASSTTSTTSSSSSTTIQQQKDKDNKFIGFSRIFSGTIRKGQMIHVLGPKYNPLDEIANEKLEQDNKNNDNDNDDNKLVIKKKKKTIHRSMMEITELYILMGRDLEPVDEVPSGNIFGIGGRIDEHVIKCATLSTSKLITSFNMMTFVSSPIVRVAVEPDNPSDMTKLYDGLKMLNQSDPSVEVYVQETGEHVIVASGELHLERCLRDLRESYSKIPIRVSPPIVSFRETVTSDNRHGGNNNNNKDGVHTSNKLGTIKVRAIPLPDNIRRFLEDNTNIIRRIFVDENVDLKDNPDAVIFRDQLVKEFKYAGEWWENQLNYLWSFGPRRCGPNILLNHIPGYCGDNGSGSGSGSSDKIEDTGIQTPFESLFNKIKENYKPRGYKDINIISASKEKELLINNNNNNSGDISGDTSTTTTLMNENDKYNLLNELNNSLINGFQLATASGPLCEEPMTGVCFIVDDVILRNGNKDDRGPFKGQIISSMKEACRQSFLSKSVRIVQAMYLCYINVLPEYMGKVFSVLGKRRSKILKEDNLESTSIISIEALLPVIESFGLSRELLTQTSGSASTQLVFHSWEILDQDPFFVATTDEELEDIGENLGGIAPNLALQYINSVRNRKGLHVHEQIVKHADKQRTLSRKK